MKKFALGIAVGLAVGLTFGCAGSGVSPTAVTSHMTAPHGSWKLNYINYDNRFKLGEFDEATVHVYDTFVIIDRAGSDDVDTIIPIEKINVMDIEYR